KYHYFTLSPYTNKVVFLLEGECFINNNGVDQYVLHAGSGVFFPIGATPGIKALSQIQIITIHLEPFINFREGYSIESLHTQTNAPTESGKQLPIASGIQHYIKTIISYHQNKLLSPELQKIKILEFLFILPLYYDKATLSGFFSPIVTNDTSFAIFIHKNWHKAKNSKELAALSSYSETSFNKKFKATFNTTPYKWLNKKRASLIYHELVVGKKTIKQISDEYGFNTLQQFNSYCKLNFSYPPVQIRKQKHLNKNSPESTL
ncbi:MAG: helix-turn-helix domain-containing protein, partial [Tannerellaceae bacterium]|nr:helix-turn-helix domain-containing protein [Tannerellaceae bacterium]